MEDSKRILSPSSSILSPSGNNENESEFQRNSQRTNKHFMAPTFSTASKFTTPKKKILEELKPTNLDSKSSLHKMGTFDSSSTKSLVKDPSCSLSPKNNLRLFDEINTNDNKCNDDVDDNEDETFVAGSCTIPYDHLTNYLSPWPKFLRDNPNRKRKILLLRGDKRGNCNNSPENSLDSKSSCTPECSLKKEDSVGNVENLGGEKMEENGSGDCNGSSLKNEEIEGNKKNLEEQDVEEEEDDDEERKWGFKRVLLEGLIVSFVLVFSTMYISSMNSPAFYPDSIRPTFEYENLGNISVMPFSVRDVEIDKGYNQLGVDGIIGGRVKAPEIELREEIMGNSDCELEETEVEEVFIRNIHGEIDYQENVRAYYGGFSEPMVESFKDVEEENEVQMAVDIVSPSLITEEESWVDSEDKINDVESKFEVENLAHEVEILAEEETFDDIEQENKGGEEDKDGDSVNVAKDAVEGQFFNGGIVHEIKGDHEREIANFKPKSEDSQIDGSSEGTVAENNDIQVRLTLKDFVWFVALAVMSFMACLVVKFYHKCKNLFSKTTFSKKKLNSEVKMPLINRSAGLPPKVGERFEKVHQKADSQVKVPLLSAVIESPKEEVKIPPRMIPNVKELGELDFGTEFNSLKSSAVRNSKVEESEARMFVVPDERRTKRSKVSSSSTPDSHSYSSNISEEKTPKQEEKAETTIRRSKRLQSRGVTSPLSFKTC